MIPRLSRYVLVSLLSLSATHLPALGSPLPEGNHETIASSWMSRILASWGARTPAATAPPGGPSNSVAQQDRACRDFRSFAHYDQFADYLSRRRETTYRCARGVREALNFLFHGESDATPGTDAHLWDIEFLNARWTTPPCRYREIPLNDSPEDFDIRVMTAPGRTVLLGGRYVPFGHVEFFYRGSWYSDHTQKLSYQRSTVAGLTSRDSSGRRLKPGEPLFLRARQYRFGSSGGAGN